MRRKSNLILLPLAILVFSLAGLTGCAGTAPAARMSELQVALTGSGSISSSPAGLNCAGQTCSGSFPTGTRVTLNATPAAGSTFGGWSGACTGTTPSCTVTLNENQTVSATFGQPASDVQLQVTVSGTGTVASSPAGISCPQTCTASFPAGTKLVLTAAAGEDNNSTFAGWGGACSGNSICNITLNSNQTVSATFTQAPVLQVSVTGSGTVTSNPAGINCGSACSAPFTSGASVALTATPAQGWKLGNWGGACSGSTGCSVTMNGSQNVSVTFVQTQPQLRVTLAGNGSGTVASTPAGINCGTTCSASFAPGTAVTLTQTAASGSSFTGWSGACTGTAACTFTMNADASVTATFNNGGNTNGIQAVNHIIFMLSENRGFEHYFGHLDQYRVSAFALPAGQVEGPPANASNPCHKAVAAGSNGFPGITENCGWDPSTTIASTAAGTSNVLSPFHLNTVCVENPTPSWVESHVDWNIDYVNPVPAMNGFVTEGAGYAINNWDNTAPQNNDIYGRRVMGYYTENELNYYYWMATQFATSDHWFSPVMSRTHPNRMYLFAATSQGHAFPIGGGSGTMNTQLTAKTIFGALQQAGISWKIYAPAGGYTYYEMFSESNSLLAGHLFTYADYQSDVQNGTLPQVALIDDDPAHDEHPGTKPTEPGQNIQYGANYVANNFINPLMQSPSWKDSVFIFTYDEAGGFYDHMPPFAELNPDGIPPQDIPAGSICNDPSKMNPVNCNFDTSGFRVPLLVISPFTKQHYVSHTNMDYTAILKFIETRFGLSPLTARDNAQPDMTEFFDFAGIPWATPPTPPAQKTNGACYFNQFP